MNNQTVPFGYDSEPFKTKFSIVLKSRDIPYYIGNTPDVSQLAWVIIVYTYDVYRILKRVPGFLSWING